MDELFQKYKYIFNSPLGREVLLDILGECHFGSILDPDNKVQVSEHNVGIMILTKCGVFGDKREKPVVNALMNSVVTGEPTKEEKKK